MNSRTQEVLLTLLGAVGLKIVFSEAYLHYVNAWMKWPILAASVILIGVSMRFVVTGTADPGTQAHAVPAVTWLLLLPVLVLFLIAPPELGAYAAERRASISAPRPPVNAPSDVGSKAPIRTTLSDFVSLAQWEPARNLTYRPVVLEGFVSKGPKNAWYVTRLGINCCAADAVAWRVRVQGAVAPHRDRWVEVTGTWIDPHAQVPRLQTAAIRSTSVRFVGKPKNTYE